MAWETTGRGWTTVRGTETTRVEACLAPKESETVVLMKGVNWEMILETRSTFGLLGTGFGFGAGLGGSGLAHLVVTNPSWTSLVSWYPSSPAVYFTMISDPYGST